MTKAADSSPLRNRSPAVVLRDRAPKRLHWWLESRFGLSVHWGLYTLPGGPEWKRSVDRLSIEQYQPYFEQFGPSPGFATQWAKLARRAGASHVVLTAKHHDGFCLWDSRLTGYTSARAPRCRRDLVREYVDALRAEGLRVGLYYSLADWHHPDYGPVFGDRQHPLRHDATQRARDITRDWSNYVRYLHGQVEELLTHYGTIDVLFFDFSYWDFAGERWGASELMRTVRRLQPGIVTNDRLGFEPIKQLVAPAYVGDFDHAEQDVPSEPVLDARSAPVPWESWITLNNCWCHNPLDLGFKSPATIVRTLVNCVSKGGNLCLNLGPDARGDIPTEQLERVEAVGRWLAQNGESVRGCGAAGLPKPEWGRWTLSEDGRFLYAHVLEQPIGHACLRGLRGWVRNPVVVATGEPAILCDYWNAGVQTFDSPDDVFLNFGSPPQNTWPLPDATDTVVRLEVVREPSERRSIVERMRVDFERATSRVPFD